MFSDCDNGMELFPSDEEYLALEGGDFFGSRSGNRVDSFNRNNPLHHHSRIEVGDIIRETDKAALIDTIFGYRLWIPKRYLKNFTSNEDGSMSVYVWRKFILREEVCSPLVDFILDNSLGRESLGGFYNILNFSIVRAKWDREKKANPPPEEPDISKFLRRVEGKHIIKACSGCESLSSRVVWVEGELLLGDIPALVRVRWVHSDTSGEEVIEVSYTIGDVKGSISSVGEESLSWIPLTDFISLCKIREKDLKSEGEKFGKYLDYCFS